MLHTLRTQSEVARELSINERQIELAVDYLEALKGYEPTCGRYSPTTVDEDVCLCLHETEEGIKRLRKRRSILLQMQQDGKHSEELKLYNFIT